MRPFLLLLPLLLLSIACAKFKDRSGLLEGVPTEEIRMENIHTGIPDLTIRVPRGFVVEWTEEARFEKYFIYNPQDTGDVQKGMIVLDITPLPPKQIPDTAKYARSRGRMAGYDVQWRERMVIEPDGVRLHQREMVTGALFEKSERFHTIKGLVLHAFVVGSDSALVERLTAVVETVAIPPEVPNL